MAIVLQHHPVVPTSASSCATRASGGSTVRDVSNETKIPRRHHEAFEHGDLTVVPNRMYRRAEVRAYAQAVGLDQNAALAELENALLFSGTADPETDALHTPDSIDRRHRIAATLSTVAVAGILLIAWLQWTKPTARGPAARPAPVRRPRPMPVGPSQLGQYRTDDDGGNTNSAVTGVFTRSSPSSTDAPGRGDRIHLRR
jgi:hypothetical protein